MIFGDPANAFDGIDGILRSFSCLCISMFTMNFFRDLESQLFQQLVI